MMDLSDIDEEYTGFGKLNNKNNYNCDLSSDYNDCDNYNKNKQKSSMKKNNKNVLLSSAENATTKAKTINKKTTAVNEDKVREKKEAAKAKLKLKLEKKRIKNIEPGECLKFITVNFHHEICKFDFYNETLSILDASAVKYSTKFSSVPNSISWTRTVENYSLDNDNKINTTTIEVNQKYLLIIWKWDKVIQLINDKLFVSSVTSLCNSSAEINSTLVIYGVEKYFEYHESKGKKKANSKLYESIENIPKVSRKIFDINLIQIQLQAKCNSRLIDEAADMSLLIYQYTKSIAEIPYKLEMDAKLNDQLDFFVSGDNKNTIQVDKEGYGLKKLWLKQLCIFNNSSLAVADAISSVYPSPQQLIEAYLNCSREDGENLLKDIPIKRSITSTAASRKLGPELSKKIYTLFTSKNGEQSIQIDK
ncbi:methyl methanesulfonate sensitivity 4 [Cotesia typhae]|uniref:methyl methanesulfonate sensitivity 4 n=1 Tax=Cotesia typhae TaxID=2053667 RepID=UPI003D69BB5F